MEAHKPQEAQKVMGSGGLQGYISSKQLLARRRQVGVLADWADLQRCVSTCAKLGFLEMKLHEGHSCFLSKDHQIPQWFTKLGLAGIPCCGLIWCLMWDESICLLCPRKGGKLYIVFERGLSLCNRV